MRIELGQEAKCLVTGYVGICIARTEWLNGCTRITLQGPVDKDGKVQDGHTFDEPQLEATGKSIEVGKKLREEVKAEKRTGGPIPEPTQNKSPTPPGVCL
jgi:hypothetical protein